MGENNVLLQSNHMMKKYLKYFYQFWESPKINILGKKISFHEKGTMVSIEGPRFSTKAESHLFRQWGCDVVNMTIVPECILAREVGIHYASIAMVTDYDCWKERDGGLSVDEIMATIEKNTSSGKKLIFDVLKHIKSL